MLYDILVLIMIKIDPNPVVVSRKFSLIRWAIWAGVFLIVPSLASLLFIKIVIAAVTLVYFQATANPTSVSLEWETATELENAGFFINRSTSQTGGFTRISAFTPARGDPLLGATYLYTDTNVSIGTTYWYRLESIDIQQRSDYFEPAVSAIPGGVNQVSPTRTSTATIPPGNSTPTTTRTPTATNQPGSATRTATAGGVNPYPGPGASQTGSQLPSGSQPTSSTIVPLNEITNTLPLSSTGTETLIPFPTITLEFPYPANVILPTPPRVPTLADTIGWFTPLRLLLIGFLLFVWVFLGGWFYFSLRRLG